MLPWSTGSWRRCSQESPRNGLQTRRDTRAMHLHRHLTSYSQEFRHDGAPYSLHLYKEDNLFLLYRDLRVRLEIERRIQVIAWKQQNFDTKYLTPLNHSNNGQRFCVVFNPCSHISTALFNFDFNKSTILLIPHLPLFLLKLLNGSVLSSP